MFMAVAMSSFSIRFQVSCFHQDQVDTLTFQNRSLRDRAKRFEEALRRSTDEQIVVTAVSLHRVEVIKRNVYNEHP